MAGGARAVLGMRMPVPGEHNALNAIAAFAVALEAGISDDVAKRAIAAFSGVKRRFTPTGSWNGAVVYDDYAHHPVEIAAVLKAARKACSGRVLAVFQPHRFSRVQNLFDDFASCFANADAVIVTPLYTAGEQPIPGITHTTMAEGIRKTGHKQVAVIDSEHELAPMVATLARAGDFIVCLGAGTITDWAYALPQRLNGAQQRAEGVA
jgi:UDP-N-acetylmuramate--alanine ligase